MDKSLGQQPSNVFVFFFLFFSFSFFFIPGSSVGNLLTRWDVGSNPGNWEFSSLKKKKEKCPTSGELLNR